MTNTMRQNQLFNQTRRNLALAYAGVMGLILTLLGIGVYRAIAHAHWIALDQELESVAGTLHDSLELKLQQPNHLEPIIYDFLPNLCQVNTSCIKSPSNPQRHLLGVMNKGDYYVRLFNSSGKLLAIAGNYPEGLSENFNKTEWQSLSDQDGNIYHQISLSLHTKNQQDWGYFQVGRSLKDFEDYLGRVKWALKIGLPISLLLVLGASWWLSGLAMQSIYHSYRQIQQFTADAAHELRTPLAATQATVESALLMPELDEKETRDILKTIKRQNQRLTQLVADLLLLARMDRQSDPLSHQLVNLNDLVNDLVEELAALARAAKITLISEIEVKGSLEILGDSEQLYRLVSNLMINAIQYTNPGGKVTVILNMIDNQAIIQVKDTGIGIALSEQKHIFDRFYRVQRDRSRHTGGAGLGLAIAMAIAQAHKGSLTVNSEQEQGSTFTIKLYFERLRS